MVLVNAVFSREAFSKQIFMYFQCSPPSLYSYDDEDNDSPGMLALCCALSSKETSASFEYLLFCNSITGIVLPPEGGNNSKLP